MAARTFGSRPFADRSLEPVAETLQRRRRPEALHRAGADPLPSAPSRVPAPPRADAVVVRAAPAPEFYVSERGGVLRGFRVTLSARERRRVSGTPRASLDLHGYDSERAERALRAFIARERKRGGERLLIIVGKGRHSAGGRGVLRAAIAEWLSAPPLARYVLGFISAPPHLGGSGSVLVLLDSAEQRGA